MATNEASFRSELLACAREQQCHAFATVADTAKGLPDVYIKHPNYPGIWVELKFRRSENQAIGMTALQRHWIRKHQSVGGQAGWAVCVKGKTTETLFAHRLPDLTHPHRGFIAQRRGRGESWDIRRLIHVIMTEADGEE